MAHVIYYHPQAENLSPKYSPISPTDPLSRQTDSDGTTKLSGYPFETLIYVLYKRATGIGDANEIDFIGNNSTQTQGA